MSQSIELLPVSYVEGAGRGVCASRDIKAGEVLEVAPALALSKDQHDSITKKLGFGEYTFIKPKEKDELNEDTTFKAVIAFGLCSICNHQPATSGNVNAEKTIIESQPGANGETYPLVELRALTDIKKGDEIFLEYGAPKFSFNILQT